MSKLFGSDNGKKQARRQAMLAKKRATKSQKNAKTVATRAEAATARAEKSTDQALETLTAIASKPPIIQMPKLPDEQSLPAATDPEVAATERRLRERAAGRGGRMSTMLASKR